MVLWRPTRPLKPNTQKRCPFHHRGLECQSRKSRNNLGHRQIWPWNTEWSRAKANRVLRRERTGHSKHPLPKTQEKTIHMESPDRQHRNPIDYILCSQRRRSSIQSAKTRPGADGGSDHGQLIAKFRLKLKKVGKTSRPFSSVQFSSVTQLCLTRCDLMDHSTPGLPVHHWLPGSTQPMSIVSVMPSNHLILCCPLLLLPSVFPSIRVFSSELALHIRWPKYWSFSFSISPSNEYPGLISFRMDWLDLLAVEGTLKSLLQYHSLKASIFWLSAFFIIQLSFIHDYWKKHSFD